MRVISWGNEFQSSQVKEVVESDDEEIDEDDDDDESDEEEDEGVAKDYKERTISLSSPRLDLLLGRALNKGRS